MATRNGSGRLPPHDQHANRARGPAWVDERKDERGDLKVLQGFASLRAERVYSEAETCGECAAARLQEQRQDALCERHLGEALGANGGWADTLTRPKR